MNGIDPFDVSSESFRLSCILCQKSSDLSNPKVLPCLHVACQGCIEVHLSSVQAGVKDVEDLSEVIFSCPLCSCKMQLSKTSLSSLRAANFLLGTDQNSGIDARESVKSVNEDVNDTVVNGNYLWLKPIDGTYSDVRLATIQPSNDVETENLISRAAQPTSKHRARKLIDAIEHAKSDCKATMNLVEAAKLDLLDSRASLRELISRRAEYLCQMITARRDHLLDDVEKNYKWSDAQLRNTLGVLGRQADDLNHCSVFSEAAIRSEITDIDTVLEEISARVCQITSRDGSRRRGQNIPEFSALRLAVPDVGSDELQIDKLFGSLATGKIGSTELIMSFNTELRWPSAFVMLRSRNSVLAGKTGAFADSGRLIFYDRHGVCTDSLTLEGGRLPVDLVASSDGCILMSDTSGRISKYSSAGHLEAEWLDMFRGTSGRMVIANGGKDTEIVIVTSMQDGVVRRYRTSDGHLVNEFTLSRPDSSAKLEASAVSSNSAGEIVVTAASDCALYIFDRRGVQKHLFRLPDDLSVQVDVPDDDKRAVNLLSAVCCDPFDNILVADFIANCIHLLSHSGHYLGRLLTEKDGISCPNFVSLDQDGRLYVGQYGGEVLVFQYLNFTKNV